MLDVFIGYDPRDDRAFRVCEVSLRRCASSRVRVTPIREWEMRRRFNYRRGYEVLASGQMIDARDQMPFSTQFSFTRFLVPALADYRNDLVLYLDPDMLVRADVFELIEICRHMPDKALYCVRHRYRPRESIKMDGVSQTNYPRKNWSSLIVWNPSCNRRLTAGEVSRRPGVYLHGFRWLQDNQIGALTEDWNWLEGWSSKHLVPKIVHFTRGTPDMPGHADAAYAREWQRVWKAVKRNRLCASTL